MTICPNCGFRHANEDYASELDDVHLPHRQFDVVLRLRQARGALVTHSMLVDFVYGDDENGGPSDALACIWSHLSRARETIKKAGWTIENDRFVGYRLVRVTQ